jgi:hypothetical protein
MDKKETIKALSELVQVDIDAVHAYDRALKEVDDKIIQSRLIEFQKEHRNHIRVLFEQIRAAGEQPPAFSQDFKGYVIEAFAALRSFTGMKGALQALQTTEEITHRYYGNWVSKKAPDTVKEILRKHFTEEKIHLDYIKSNLEALSAR